MSEINVVCQIETKTYHFAEIDKCKVLILRFQDKNRTIFKTKILMEIYPFLKLLVTGLNLRNMYELCKIIQITWTFISYLHGNGIMQLYEFC